MLLRHYLRSVLGVLWLVDWTPSASALLEHFVEKTIYVAFSAKNRCAPMTRIADFRLRGQAARSARDGDRRTGLRGGHRGSVIP